MDSSIRFLKRSFDGSEELEIETLPLKRQAINPKLKAPLIFIILIAIVAITLLLLSIVIIVSVESSPVIQCGTGPPILMVMSLDGFRPDYLDSGLIPSLHNLGEDGIRAEFLMSQFPTKTFPNHYTIATGLHPAWHGIVDNSFFDKDLNKSFGIHKKSTNNPEWWLGTPIWKRARDQGLVTAAYYWPGSEVSKYLPNFYFPYKFNTPLRTQLQKVNKWLAISNQSRPQLIMLYFYNPDHVSHTYGYYSSESNASLRAINSDLHEFLMDTFVWNCVDKIFVSDHGFANVSLNKTLYLEDVIDLNLINPIQLGPVITFNVKNHSQTDSILEKLRKDPNHGVNFNAYRSTQLPSRMHYGIGPRYADIVVLTKTGWLMFYDHRFDKVKRGGEHGWDNHASDMRALFIAQGPSFKQNYRRSAIENVHLFDLLATLLRIQPGGNNGSRGALNDVIADTFNGELPAPEPSPFTSDTDTSCSFPSTEEILLERVFSSQYLCKSCNKTTAAIEFLHSLNLSQKEIDAMKSSFIPGGLPRGGGGSFYCYLANGDSLVKYNKELRVPVWAAYKLNFGTSVTIDFKESVGGCSFLNDPRIPTDNSPLCAYYTQTSEYSMTSLFDIQFAKKGSHLTSATLPLQTLPQYFINKTTTKLKSALSPSYVVITGSLFISPTTGEMTSDHWTHWLGANTIAIPSHIYQIIIPCGSGDCTLNREAIISYIVENKDISASSGEFEVEYQLRYTTVREIERVSGVDFFPQLSDKQQLDIELHIRTSF